jgi:hypothetical protein
MAERPRKKSRIAEITNYRSSVAERLVRVRSGDADGAIALLQTVRRSPAYQVARALEFNPSHLLHSGYGLAGGRQLHGGEEKSFRYYVSNEYYPELAPQLRGLGGVGISVGSDQPLDFFTMGNLRRMYAVDIDTHTHLVTRGYLEVGARFHRLMGRYPTANEYIDLFQDDNINATLGLLSANTTGYNFTQTDIDWLGRTYDIQRIGKYLREKNDHYGNASWIGSDQNLANVIQAYEQDRIKVCQGSIVGNVLPQIASEVRAAGEYVSLIYTSNAPIKKGDALTAFKELPIKRKTVVVFSKPTFRGYDRIPQSYSFAMSWSHFVFSPRSHDSWPMAEESQADIARGYAFLRPSLRRKVELS